MESENLVIINGRFDGGDWTAHQPENVSGEDMMTYITAHRLIPFDFEWGVPGSTVLADMALALLADDSRDRVEHLWSLTLLGHVPTLEALAVLETWADSDHSLAGVAELAARECADWMREPGAPAS